MTTRIHALLTGIAIARAWAIGDGECEDVNLLQIAQSQQRVSLSPDHLEMAAATVPMDVIDWDKDSSFISFGINVTPSTPETPAIPGTPVEPQRMVFDLGSSTIGFCDNFVGNQALHTTNWKTCLEYGIGLEAWWGYVYQGGLDLLSASGSAPLNNGTWATMQTQFNMPCIGGMKGIFGAAFSGLNRAFGQLEPLHWAATLDCPATETATLLPATFIGAVRRQYGNMFGMHWTGELGYSTAALHLGADAAAACKPELSVGKTPILSNYFYEVNITKYSYNGIEVPATCSNDACFIDSGAPKIGFPPEIMKALKEQSSGTVKIELAGAGSGAPVVLELSVATLIERNWLDGYFVGVLSLPVFAFYYFLFDVNAEAPTVEFAKQSSLCHGQSRDAGRQVPNAVSQWPRVQLG